MYHRGNKNEGYACAHRDSLCGIIVVGFVSFGHPAMLRGVYKEHEGVIGMLSKRLGFWHMRETSVGDSSGTLPGLGPELL